MPDESRLSYYGWRVVVAANLGLMVGFSLYAYTFSMFMKPLAAQFNWSREAIADGFAISALTAAICSPLAGWWLDRRGPRGLLLACISLFGAAFSSMAMLGAGIWQFYLTCFALGAVGNVMQMGYAHAISTWFSTYRGRALGIVLAGEGVGLMIFPVLAQSLIDRTGWRAAYAWLGLLILAIGVPPAVIWARARGDTETTARGPAAGGSTLVEGLSTYSFWIIVAVLFLDSISINGAMTHQVPLLTDRGIAAARAASAVSLLGVASLSGRLATGWLLDRFPGSWVAFVLLLLAAAGILLLARTASFAQGCTASLMLGVGAGGTSSVTPYLLTRYFGLRSFSRLYGLTWTFYAIAGGAGPVILGHAFDRTGSYTSSLTLLGIACAVAATLMLLLPRYRTARFGEIEHAAHYSA